MDVGYGAVLGRFGTEIEHGLDDHEDELYEIMHQHFVKHVGPFGTRGLSAGLPPPPTIHLHAGAQRLLRGGEG
jgi:hypothetical protein